MKKWDLLFAVMVMSFAATAQDRLYIHDFSILVGKTNVMTIELENSKAYSAFQLDVELPEGVTLINSGQDATSITLDPNRCDVSHTVAYNEYKRGVIRIVAYSNTKAEFKGNSGPLLHLTLKANAGMPMGMYEVRLSKIIFTDKTNTDYMFNTIQNTVEAYQVFHISATSANTLAGIVVTNDCGESVKHGTSVTLTAEPLPGYEFSNWTVGGVVRSTENPYTFTAEENLDLVANFIPLQYDVVFNVDGELFTTSQDFGSIITKPADPTKEGHIFMGWSPAFVEGTTIPVGGITYTALWETNTYKVIYLVDGNEYHVVEVKYGEAIPVEEAPVKEGHTFSGWSEIPTTMPAADITITGSFSINSYTLTYLVDETVYHSESLTYGTSITPLAPPAKDGYIFNGWSEIPETMPASDVTVIGSFTFDYNTDAHKRLTAQIEELQAVFDSAKTTIETECKDVAQTFWATITSIQESIDALVTDVETRYKNAALTAESTIETESIISNIEKLVADAKAAQKEYEDGLFIGSVNTGEKVIGIYSLTGKKVSETRKGMIYLFRYECGKTVKRVAK